MICHIFALTAFVHNTRFLFHPTKRIGKSNAKEYDKGDQEKKWGYGVKAYFWGVHMDKQHAWTEYGLYPIINECCATHLLPSSQHYVSIIQQTPTPTSICQNLLGKQHGGVSNGQRELSVRSPSSDSRQIYQYRIGFSSLPTISSTLHQITSAERQSISMELAIPNQIRTASTLSKISTWLHQPNSDIKLNVLRIFEYIHLQCHLFTTPCSFPVLYSQHWNRETSIHQGLSHFLQECVVNWW